MSALNHMTRGGSLGGIPNLGPDPLRAREFAKADECEDENYRGKMKWSAELTRKMNELMPPAEQEQKAMAFALDAIYGKDSK